MGNQPQRRVLEDMAEWLAVEQLDLLAQVEAQVRAVHHTMRSIEKLRGGRHHIWELQDPKVARFVDKNRFPRTVLLETEQISSVLRADAL